ncbi:uncharacterized protein LOC107712335 [Sinocyclocheilus rhinocerous]|uniref:uncharacterized protein LOC107712335 n=1 Tax=Sinocyclocheilus rhinocerous TaxID=307959 RepID=UPI0007B9FB67|nr:PREDICTED: uncharacterized protein LOC107712335 [Sinocyclocheilus rhinocerous]
MATAKPVVRTRWTSEMEEQLVEMWQQHDCLFNVSSKLYHNRSDKEKSWGEIASVLNVPVEDVKMRATTLRTQFTKLLKPKPSSSGEKGLTQKQRWLLSSLEFLKKHVAQRPSETSLDQSVKDLLSEGQDIDDPTSDEDITDTSEALGPHTSTQQEGQDHSSLFPTPRPALKRRKADTDTVEQQKLKLLQQMSASVLASPDACSSFGNQVAVELRLIKNTSLQTRVKRKIMNALFEAQEADQSSSSSSSHMPPPIYSPLTPTQMPTSTPLYTQTPQHYHQHMPPQGPVQPQNFLRMLELEE